MCPGVSDHSGDQSERVSVAGHSLDHLVIERWLGGPPRHSRIERMAKIDELPKPQSLG